VGDLVVDDHGIARRGLIIRHLVLPDNIAKTDKVIDFVNSISQNTYFNLMDQYRPAFNSNKNVKINRRLRRMEYEEAYNYAVSVGLKRLAN
jgi:putative pyruvate formate lyase activating enzyme